MTRATSVWTRLSTMVLISVLLLGAASAATPVAAVQTAPQISAVSTIDWNDDGDVDTLTVWFTESIDDSASTLDATTFTLGTGSVGSVGSGTKNDDRVDIVLTSPISGTDATPSVELQPGKVYDTDGETISSAQLFSGTTDGAKPVIESGTYFDNDGDGEVDRVTLTFSESITYTSATTNDWSITANGLSNLRVNSNQGSVTDTLTLGVDAAADTTGTDGGSEPFVSYNSAGYGTIEDAANNEAVDGTGTTLTDAAKPTITDLEIRDTDSDRKIDEVVLTFSEYVDTDDGAAPVAADVGTLTLPDGSTADLSGATFTDPAGSSRTLTVSNVAGQSALNTAAGSSGVSGDLSSNWVDATGNALVSTLDDESVTDSAAPVPLYENYQDTNGDGTVDRVDITYSEPITGSYVDSEWSVDTAGSVSLSKAGTGTVSTKTVQVDVKGTADTTGGATSPRMSYSGSSITDQSASSNALSSLPIIPSDHAAPVITGATYRDTSGDGAVDRIDVDYSEDVSASKVEAGDYKLGGSDADSVTIEDAKVSGSKVALTIKTKLSTPSLTLDYSASAGHADSITDGKNAAKSVAGVSVADGVVPDLTAAETLDRDGDGKVDAANLTFSEAVSDKSVTPGDYAIGGQAADAMDTLSTKDDDTIQVRITVDKNEVSGTDGKEVTYTAGSTTDTAGNALGSVVAGDVSETDGAAPVITSFALSPDAENEELDVSFDASESLSTVSVSVSGAESAKLTSFSASKSTYTASMSVRRNGDYTATLDTADDATGNGASTLSDAATVAFFDDGGSWSPSDLSDTSSRARLSGSTGLSEVGVSFGDGAGATVRVSETSLDGSTPPGTFVSAADITVPDSFTETSSTLKFAIGRDRLAELGVSPSELVVYRLHDGSWDALDTRVIDGEGDTVVVEADTPGFSRFAVMADDATSSTPAQTATPAQSNSGQVSEGTDASAADDTSATASADASERDDAASADDTTASQTPGFGVGVALVSLLAFLAVGLRRRD